ncbi:citrate lyase subunit alpha [Pectinatus cerevisiiphilus]|uniref:Citrate lyase alpha chain n=1 Tax=Pectinatus cerevisiiphilus TaxID=86956 RepID=A0A4V2URM2_9FIRM|nr:citrate lyase subunit alpha [Pectinatus cerevisiiphilus]TCS78222.1 citrate lyase subunit alpha/citrate CoA-transferase [Pectinatus cerevisiiphilus]
MKNEVGRELPDLIKGLKKYRPYRGLFIEPDMPIHMIGRTLHTGKKNECKILPSLVEAVKAVNLKDGMTISFHHHFRNGDYVVKLVMAAIAKCGIKDITIASSSLNDCHDFLIDYIENGTVTAIETSGLRGKLGAYLTNHPRKLKHPVIIRSHGGRARAIESGELKIDVAFMGVPTCDKFGNATGQMGKSACGSLGYAMVDTMFAEKVVLITDNLIDGYVYPYSISQTNVNYIVKVNEIGDPQGIASGILRLTKNPVKLMLAKTAEKVIEYSGYFKNGFSIQLGGGGASLAVSQFLRNSMLKEHIKGGFGVGGITGVFSNMLEEGLFEICYDAQTFDTTAIQSLKNNSNHVEISTSFYANPWNAGPIINDLDIVILGATEVDLNFNVNVITNSNGILMGASGGHSDIAAASKLSIIVMPLIRGRLPMIKDNVQNIVTPGSSIDVIVTDRGIAVNPRRKDLSIRLNKAGLPIVSIEELQAIAQKLVGKPQNINLSHDDNDIVAIIEYRDGSLIDVVRKPL